MSIFTDDVLNFTSVLKMAYNFLTGRDYVRKKKTRDHKTVVSLVLPFSDLAYAAGAVPVFPIRMARFQVHKYLMALNSASSLLGWNLTAKLLEFVRQFDVLKLIDNVLNDVINEMNQAYNKMYDEGIECGISPNSCYGIKSLTGMHHALGTQVDASLNFTTQCNAWNNYLESIKKYNPNQIWIDIPPRDKDNALEITMTNVSNAIDNLEELTGNIVTDNSLQKQFRIGNQVKRYYRTIIYEIAVSDFYPCNPATFAEILSLVGISYQDFNSNAQRFLENMSNLVKEMRERIKKGIGMDVSKMPRILLTPVYCGWEPQLGELLYKLGGRIILADWEILNLLDEIDVSKNSDPVEQYAKFVLNVITNGSGANNEELIASFLKTSKLLNMEGLIYNQLSGCGNGNCYPMLREKIHDSIEIPTTTVEFSKIGEGIEQTKTKLTAFMELFF